MLNWLISWIFVGSLISLVKGGTHKIVLDVIDSRLRIQYKAVSGLSPNRLDVATCLVTIVIPLCTGCGFHNCDHSLTPLCSLAVIPGIVLHGDLTHSFSKQPQSKPWTVLASLSLLSLLPFLSVLRIRAKCLYKNSISVPQRKLSAIPIAYTMALFALVFQLDGPSYIKLAIAACITGVVAFCYMQVLCASRKVNAAAKSQSQCNSSSAVYTFGNSRTASHVCSHHLPTGPCAQI